MTKAPLKQPQRHTIGTAAREARLSLGLTQEDLADRLGIATEVYGRMERGTASPSIVTLRKLCVALNLSADKVLGTTVNFETPRSAEKAASPPEPESWHMVRMIRRARKLDPYSLRLLCQLAAMLPKKTDRAEDTSKDSAEDTEEDTLEDPPEPDQD